MSYKNPRNLKNSKSTVIFGLTLIELISYCFIFAFIVITGLILSPLPLIQIIFILFSLIVISVLYIKINRYNVRLYVIVLRWIRFIFSKKKYSKKDFNLIFPYKNINNQLILTKNLKIAVIKFGGLNLTDENNIELQLKKISDIFNNLNDIQFSIYKTNENYDLSKNADYFKSCVENIENVDEETKFKTLNIYSDNLASDLDTIESNYNCETYYLILRGQLVSAVEKNCEYVIKEFFNLGMNTIRLNNEELVNFIAKLNFLEIDYEKLNEYNSQQTKLNEINLVKNEINETGLKKILLYFLSSFYRKELNKLQKINFSNFNEFKQIRNNKKSDKLSFKELNNKYKEMKQNNTLIKNNVEKTNINLAEVFKPKEFNIKFNKIVAENIAISFQEINELNNNLNYFWIKDLLNSPSDVLINFDRLDEDKKEKIINKVNLNLQNANIPYANKLKQAANEEEIECFEELIYQLTSLNNELFSVSIIFINKGTNAEIKELENININNARNIKAKINNLKFKQFEAFEYKYLVNTNHFSSDFYISSDNLFNGFGFDYGIFNDKNNLILGTTTNNELVLFNNFIKQNNRTNHNMFILGSSGRGKTTLTKKMIMNYLFENKKVIVIDPQDEYKDLTSLYNGQNINFNDSNISINPLQVRVDIESELNNKSIINKHIEFVREFFNILIKENSNEMLNILNDCLIKLYQKMNIYDNNVDISKISESEWITLSDLYNEIEHYLDNETDDFRVNYLKIYVYKLLNLLKVYFMDNGIYANLYNRYSNIDLTNQLIVFNTKDFNSSDINNINTKISMFSILNYIQNLIYENKQQEIVLVIDEAHIYIDSTNMTNLNFMFKMTKTIRKFNGSIILTTQNPSDFISDNNVSKKAEAILQNCDYSIMLGLQSNDISAINELFKNNGGINESEKNYLASANKGEFILRISNNFKLLMKAYYNDFERQILIERNLNYEN